MIKPLVKPLLTLALVVLVTLASIHVSAQTVSRSKVERIVKEALQEMTVDYPQIERERGYVEVEFKILYRGMMVSKAERKFRDTTKSDSGYMDEFKSELIRLLPATQIIYSEYDLEDDEWEVHLYLGPGIDLDKIKVDARTGNLKPD